MRHPLLCLACAGLLVWAPAFAASTDDVAARLQAATQAHEQGRLTVARQAFERLARDGVPAAQYNLASMYEAGDGVDQDLRLARYWYGIAAKNGDIAAPAKVKQLDAQLGEPEPAPSPTPTTRP